eukprot:Colp12_sorted_trinity150504_noHs@15058
MDMMNTRDRNAKTRDSQSSSEWRAHRTEPLLTTQAPDDSYLPVRHEASVDSMDTALMPHTMTRQVSKTSQSSYLEVVELRAAASAQNVVPGLATGASNTLYDSVPREISVQLEQVEDGPSAEPSPVVGRRSMKTVTRDGSDYLEVQ